MKKEKLYNNNLFVGISYNTNLTEFSNGEIKITYHSFNSVKGIVREKKAAGETETCSDVARRIGWSESIWDLSEELPKLK